MVFKIKKKRKQNLSFQTHLSHCPWWTGTWVRVRRGMNLIIVSVAIRIKGWKKLSTISSLPLQINAGSGDCSIQWPKKRGIQAQIPGCVFTASPPVISQSMPNTHFLMDIFQEINYIQGGIIEFLEINWYWDGKIKFQEQIVLVQIIRFQDINYF